MYRWIQAVLLLVFASLVVRGNEVQLDQKDANRQQCSGMYSKNSWGGAVDPFILVKFLKPKNIDSDADPIASLVIFEWTDEGLIGKPIADSLDKQYICTQDNINQKYCKEEDIGKFILADNAKEESSNDIHTEAIHLKEPPAIKYPVLRTGYYCVGTYAFSDNDYIAIVEFRNAYGELPASQIAKLPFYGGLTIVYAVVAAFWGFLYYQNRSDILPVQNYITAILLFLIVEMSMTWGYYDYQNRHGSNAGAKILMVLVSILNAGRNSFSFFLLLIVCMGYGVVKPSLGKTMIIVRWLAITHFVFGVIYATASLTVSPDSAGPLVLLVVLPLAATLTAFYVWTLNSLSMTIKDLFDRKQRVKGMMYRKLWWCILGSILSIFGFFFLTSLSFAGTSDPDFVPEHWKTRWFILDGWLNLVYLADVCFVAYLWRPTANNRRFAMSDEIAQDDDGFEIASVRNSLDDEEEGGARTPNGNRPPPYDPSREANRSVSPMPAPKPQKPMAAPRQSLDGETIFAVGDEDGDKWSDEDDDGEITPRRADEKKRLAAKDD